MLRIGQIRQNPAAFAVAHNRSGRNVYHNVLAFFPIAAVACAVAARLNTGLTEMNKPLHIVPAGGGPLSETLELPGTKILMKSGRQIPRVVETLRSHGCL